MFHEKSEKRQKWLCKLLRSQMSPLQKWSYHAINLSYQQRYWTCNVLFSWNEQQGSSLSVSILITCYSIFHFSFYSVISKSKRIIAPVHVLFSFYLKLFSWIKKQHKHDFYVELRRGFVAQATTIIKPLPRIDAMRRITKNILKNFHLWRKLFYDRK